MRDIVLASPTISALKSDELRIEAIDHPPVLSSSWTIVADLTLTMRDADVRQSLRVHLDTLHAHDVRTRVIDELDLCGQVRVDVAVVNGYLAGYELKSARDTLRRLPLQVELYSKVLDWATLVVAASHVDHALPLLPRWWGVMVAIADDDAVRLEVEREPQANQGVDASALVRLLWRDEALRELEQRGCDRGVRTKNRRALWDRLVQEVPLPELQSLVRECLKRREGWRSDR